MVEHVEYDQEPEVVVPEVVQRREASLAMTSRDRAEFDIAIATAKRYPRSVEKSISMAMSMATLNEEIAASCFYVLRRKEGGGGSKTIEGPSIRLAEIMASSWGNIAVDTQPAGEDNKFIYATGICRDLERNVTVRKTVRRRITTKDGRRYSDDMIAVTANAAASIAQRNAVASVVPGAYIKQVYDAAKRAAMGDAKTLEKRRSEAIEYTRKMGLSDDRVFAALEVSGIADITLDKLGALKGMCTAVKDGDIGIDEQFPPIVSQAAGQSRADAATADMKAKLRKEADAAFSKPIGKVKKAPASAYAREFDPVICGEAKCPNAVTTDTGEIVQKGDCAAQPKCARE